MATTMLTELVTRSLTFETYSEAYQQGYSDGVQANVPEPYRSVLEDLGYDDGTCTTCEQQTVGPILVMDEDTGADRASWNWLTIATDGVKTWLLCEECSSALVAPYVPQGDQS